jgi:cyclophilin family peptidyl-prolyl cis-trans isomerase/protein-disulfide isomerase
MPLPTSIARPGRLLRLLVFLVGGLLSACSAAKPSPAATFEAPSSIASAPTAMPGCRVVSAEPTPASQSPLTAVSSADYVRGPSVAPVTLVAYCDFQSAECELFNRVLDQLQADHQQDLRIVLRPFPIPAGVVPALDKSEIAAQAAVAAGDQGKFWQMRDLLHARYSDWSKLSAADFGQWLTQQTSALGLDQKRFETDLQSSEVSARVRALYDSGTSLGISGVPTVFINGQLVQRAALSYDGLESTIGLVVLGSRQFKTCPAFDLDTTKQYSATLHTARGDIVIRLYAEQAPLAVNSFIYLARHGWFDGVTFHRVIPGFVAQAGDPSGTGRGGPGYYFDNEIRTDLNFDKAGVVGMANAGPDTNGSQFFITYAPEPQLDGSYTIFGQVVSGMDVATSLTPRDPQSSTDLPPGDKILSVSIEEQ